MAQKVEVEMDDVYENKRQKLSAASAWHVPDSDYPLRKTKTTQIRSILGLDKRDANDECLVKIPDIAKRMEEEIYHQAVSTKVHLGNRAPLTVANKQKSLQEYCDEDMLKLKLQQYRQSSLNVISHMRPSQQEMSQHQAVVRQVSTASTDKSLSSGQGVSARPAPSKPIPHPGQMRQNQLRLQQLRHAASCTAASGTCTVLPNCDVSKALWNHIHTCKSKECGTPHCITSKYLVSHVKKCKELDCQLCQPFRQRSRPC